MINVELNYNPYLLETKIRFNGQPPRVNSLVEKYQNGNLQSWVSRIPKIFYDEMNGYYFELDFTGTELDFEELCSTFRKAGITEEIVRIVHKECIEGRIAKHNKLEDLLKWLESTPNKRFDYDAFRAENADLFDGGYSYVFLHGRELNGAGLEDMDVSVEYVDKAHELNNTNLVCTPILIRITENTLPLLASDIAYFKARADVTEGQLFFSIGEILDRKTTERVICDLGIANPQIVESPADTAVRKYIEVYPISSYIWNALNCLRKEYETLGSELEVDNEKSIITNREIHEKIDGIEKVFEKLENAKDFFEGFSDSAPATAAAEMENDLLKKINDWRGRKTKINKFDEAMSAATEFERDAQKLVSTYSNKIKSDATDKIEGVRKDFETEYNNAQYDEFEPQTKLLEIPDIRTLESFANKLMDKKVERYVEVKEDILGMFFKGRQTEEIQMELETTYYYKDWREYVSQLVKEFVDEYVAQLKSVYKEYLNNLRYEYLAHINHSIEKEKRNKDEVSSQLSEDEKLLQIDNEWLARFNEQRVAIERG